jgi:hypothetical protein
MNENKKLNPVERRFLEEIKHHLDGWKRKIETDFSKKSYEAELAALSGDPVYQKFAFDCPEYVMVRLMGRVSISVGRRLGEIYDKIPRFVASARFNIKPEQVAEKFSGLELDIALRFKSISQEDREHIAKVLKDFGTAPAEDMSGLAIEIRYNFNPNASARLRKDVDMATLTQKARLFPLYLIYSGISPRNEAIARLTRAGWTFLQGSRASDFSTALFGADFLGIMEKSEVKEEIHGEVRAIMRSIFESHAFKQVSVSQPKVHVS